MLPTLRPRFHMTGYDGRHDDNEFGVTEPGKFLKSLKIAMPGYAKVWRVAFLVLHSHRVKCLLVKRVQSCICVENS